MRIQTCVRPVTALAVVALFLAPGGAPHPDIAPAVDRLPRADTAPLPLTVDLPAPRRSTAAVVVAAPTRGAGVPANVLAAYRAAEAALARSHPGCHLRWHHLAGIGVIESGHARGGQATPEGDTAPRILGPRLDGGPGIAAIPDTDDGRLDSDLVWDRAVGPMQFIPSTWAAYGVDADGDGDADPHHLTDAAAAAGAYLCSGGMDLADPGDLRAAIFRYNHSDAYVAAVMSWTHTYSGGATPLAPRPAGSPDVVLLTTDTPRPVQTPEPAPVPAPVEQEKPAKPAKPAKPVKPAKPAEPAKPVEPAEPAEPAEPVAPAEVDADAEEGVLDLPCGLLENVIGELGDEDVLTAACAPDWRPATED